MRDFFQKIRIFTFLLYIQHHKIGENSTKVLDFSMLLRYTAQRQKKKNCNYRRQFRKSVQPFHAKEVCPTFWDRPPSELLFSPGVFFAYSDADIEV